jgi:hypothetical protein
MKKTCDKLSDLTKQGCRSCAYLPVTLAFCIVLVLLVGCASGSGISYEVGITWIEWTWDFQNATVYLDGELVTLDSDQGLYLISGLAPNERHVLSVLDTDNLTPHNCAATTKYDYNPLVLLFIVMAFVFAGRIHIIFPVIAMIPAFSLMLQMSAYSADVGEVALAGFLFLAVLVHVGDAILKEVKKRGWG